VEGECITSSEGIAAHFFEYFCERWRADVNMVSNVELDVIPRLLNEEDNG